MRGFDITIERLLAGAAADFQGAFFLLQLFLCQKLRTQPQFARDERKRDLQRSPEKTKPCTRTETEKGVSNAERVRSVLNRDKERERKRERERGTCKKCANQKREKKSRRCPSLSVVHKTV